MDQTENVTGTPQPRNRFFSTYRQTLPAILRHPATWLLVALWFVSWLILFLNRQPVLIGLLYLIPALVVVLLIVPLTQGAPPAPWERELPEAHPGRLWLQVGILLLSNLVVTFMAIALATHISLPIVSTVLNNELLTIIVSRFFEVLLPLALVLLLGVGLRELGLQRGYHIWRTTALVCAPLIVILLVGLVQGKVAFFALLLKFGTILLITGLPEELGFRGILMTRLIRLTGTGWGIALSALLFGLYHFGADITNFGSTNLLIVLAGTMYAQMGGGVLNAILLLRTRSLIPGIIFHALNDTVVI